MKTIAKGLHLTPETIVRLAMLSAIRGETHSKTVEAALDILWREYKDIPTPNNNRASKALRKAAPKVIEDFVELYKESNPTIVTLARAARDWRIAGKDSPYEDKAPWASQEAFYYVDAWLVGAEQNPPSPVLLEELQRFSHPFLDWDKSFRIYRGVDDDYVERSLRGVKEGQKIVVSLNNASS